MTVCIICHKRDATDVDEKCDICFQYEAFIDLLSGEEMDVETQDEMMRDFVSLKQQIPDEDELKRAWFVIITMGERYPDGGFPADEFRAIVRGYDIEKVTDMLMDQCNQMPKEMNEL